MYEDPKSKISELERVLDAREDLVTKKIKRHELHDRDSNIKQDWDDNGSIVGAEISSSTSGEEESVIVASEDKKKISFPVKILIGSAVFFLVAVLIVAYNFIMGGNIVSGNNIEMTVKAPISVAGGEVVSFELEINNNNNTTLVGADLGVTFPLGTKDGVDATKEIKRVQTYLGDILPGQSVKKNLSVILFGVENEKKQIDITLEYKVAGSNSLFNKTKSVTILISSAPVSLVVTGPTEVNTNQSVDYNVEITSNSPTIIKNLLLKVDYPFGFVFSGSNPKTFTKNNLWLIGDLEPGAKRTIKFYGILSGQEGEERGFTFSLGAQSKSDNQVIDTPFSSSFSSVTIRRPFVSADIFLNGVDSAELVSRAGEKVDAVIKWQNNLPYEVSNVSFAVKINGNSVNKSSIQVSGGFYRSIDNTIIFNKTTNPALAVLEPATAGESGFSFNSFSAGSVTGGGLINPTITLNILVNGSRVDYQGGQDQVLFSDSRKIKITSDPQLSAKALYYIGPFKNSGPVPPKAEKETTYTITWTVVNPLNNLSNAQVSAILPPYMKWLGAVSPSQEKVDYDGGTGQVTWSLGNISAGAGSVSPPKEVSFQVSLLPSVGQIGTSPDLIGEAILTAKDSFTLTPVSDSSASLNTRLSSDPYFKANDEVVAQ